MNVHQVKSVKERHVMVDRVNEARELHFIKYIYIPLA